MTTTELHERIAKAIREIEVYELADLADVAIDNREAREFLTTIRDEYADAIDEEGQPDDDQAHQIADGAPSIWNHERMLQLVGTRTYLEEPELATGGEDILTLAGYVLYEVARRLVAALNERYDELADKLADEV